MSRPSRLRFAPSPTGSLHLGNARTALFNWLVARRSGGRLVLRIEDTDTERHRAGSEQGILDDLRWLGLDWDEGPDLGGPFGPYRQSERGERYRAEAERLLDGGQAYRCFCSEAEAEADRSSGPGYSGRCRPLSTDESSRRAKAGEPFAVRFNTLPDAPGGPDGDPEARVAFEDRLRGRVEFDLAQLGDPVLLRRDGRPTYNFAVVVDDAAMEISLVVRGDDHLSNTPRQVLLFQALGRPLPEFAHLPMVRGADGGRLSKRHGAVSVLEHRERGFRPEALLNALALLGWAPGPDRTLIGREELVAAFDLDRVSRSAALFDAAKLDWISQQYFQEVPAAELARLAVSRLADCERLPADAVERAPAWAEQLAEMLRPSLERLDQVPERSAGLFADGTPADDEARSVLSEEGAGKVVAALGRLSDGQALETGEDWKRLQAAIREATGLRGKSLFRPLRVTITGRTSGPELDRLVPLIAAGNRIFPDRIPSLSERAVRCLG